ncbi:MAG TPA: AraC family transcriptional regulator [Saprospiraceae bacterium]|nr:AraC family transcriptional regulator [Saprospiraceae bacterium]HNT22568.1 AraC family transcriptional regulator [Saprospiraceae bacterium]
MPDLTEKNTVKSENQTSLFQDEGVFFDRWENHSDQAVSVPSFLRKDRVHFYFGLEGHPRLHFGPYIRQIDEHSVTFLYNPLQDHAYVLELKPGVQLYTLFISLDKLHRLFSQDELPILHSEQIQQKFYQDKPMSQAILLTLSALARVQLNKSLEHTFYYAKLLELVSLYFSDKESDNSSCPFLNDVNVLKKIKDAKEILIRDLKNPPTIENLAQQVSIPEYQLKSGFKEIYGNTVYGYLLARKMEQARRLMDSSSPHVNEVAYALGYSNPSHFIAAFKKHFGVTPKKYLMGK